MTDAVSQIKTASGLAPFSLKDAPSFIERQFPVGRVSAEAFKERTAKQAQTLTALGAYWKGRKPLILVRAVVLGTLLPATENPAADLDVFLKLLAIDDDAFGRRFDGSASEFAKLFPGQEASVAEQRGKRTVWRDDITIEVRQQRIAAAFASIPYQERIKLVRRAEECDEPALLAPIWTAVNAHLRTSAKNLPELVQQLGVARYGHRPKLADTFCGGGSIPFESARIGCDVYASDLNPIACMLTWGAFNIVGAPEQRRLEIEAAQRQIAVEVDQEIVRLGIEHDSNGNRAKNYLYALEVRCPRTGWMVPLAPSWVITKDWNVIAKLVPNHAAKRYEIEIHTGVSDADMAEAEQGTIREGRVVHPMNPERSGVELKIVRGDYRDADGVNRNKLRPWTLSDFVPHPEDVFQERLYAIQWMKSETLHSNRQETFFAAATEDDLAREQVIETIVRDNLAQWQAAGLVPDMPIQPGFNNTQPIRERGWTHWHHLFSARQLLFFAILRQAQRRLLPAEGIIDAARLLDRSSKLPKWSKSNGSGGQPTNVFDNQALNTQSNYGTYASTNLLDLFVKSGGVSLPDTKRIVAVHPAAAAQETVDIFVTDPPYADAVNYHEITEFFIAWLRRNPPSPFDQWMWDSQRSTAIKGKDEQFRRDMVTAYAAMTKLMPDNGLQVVMFTHQDAGVWADLGAILWAAGLKVSSAWNVVTEAESAMREGNYVQGTVNLVLRKRLGDANARRMDIEAEIEDAVADQIDRLTALDGVWHERANAEVLYTDGDLTLAAYAAALQVVTSYSSIDRQPLDRDLYRKLAKNETTMLRELVEYAANVANRRLVPEGFDRGMWSDLESPERFYVRMLDMEAKGNVKFADFQNFSKSFAFVEYKDLMASTVANAAFLAGAGDLQGRMLDGEGFASTQLRQVLFAIWKTMESGTPDPKKGVTILKTEYAADYWQRRQKLIAFASYVAAKTKKTRPDESAAAHELAEALKVDRV